MANFQFKTSEEIFSAGYCMPAYNIMSSMMCWVYRGVYFRTTPGAVTVHQNEEPNIPLVRFEEVHEKQWRKT